MIPCQTVSDHLWDWLQEGAGHPLHSDLDSHLASCAPCRARRDTLATLRSTLKATTETAPAGFAERLRSRLAEPSPDARFEPDPWLEDVEPPAALVVDRRHPAWWRPLALVAGGAAAVVVFGLLTRQPVSTGGGVPAPGAVVVEQAVPAPAPADSADPGMATGTAPEGRTGLLAERPYDGDSSQARARLPEGRERLTPVGTAP